ncbi:MAG: transketolase C-terminal domain-containing protein [Terriglobia bacterium]
MNGEQVPDQVYQTARQHFSEKGQVDLTMAVIATNGWNRLSVSFRKKAGTYRPARIDLFRARPIDQATLIEATKAVQGRVITVEAHYGRGGVGDAVLEALACERVEVHKLAINEIPHSGKPAELLDRYGISAEHIIQRAVALAGQTRSRRQVKARQIGYA